jgi:hypothetical protein
MIAAGLPIRNIEENKNVSISGYRNVIKKTSPG